MGSTFTQAKEKSASAVHSVSGGASEVRARAARMAHRAADQTTTALDRAQHQAAATAHTVQATATGTTVRTRTLIGIGAAAAVAVLAWLGLRGRVD